MAISIQHHDSAFGNWLMAHWSPPQLAGLVDALWYFEGRVTIPRERVFPDGRVELIIHLGPVYHQVYQKHTEPYSTCCVSGLLLQSNVIQAPAGPCAVLGVRLRPASAFALLARPLHELAGITVDLTDLLGSASQELAERCHQAPWPEQRLRVAAEWIAQRCARTRADAAVLWVAQQIEAHSGGVSINGLRQRTGWSKTRLTSLFEQQIGVTPKRFARIHRFRRALQLVHTQTLPLAHIALTAGYYDQSHFNAEFREHSGFTPTEYLAAQRYPGSGSLAEGVA
jgi:AraC-like DNA-binding protein